jgi:DNA-binding MarR family transcriptional regulator
MEPLVARNSRDRTPAQALILQILQTVGELALPTPGAVVSLASLTEVCKRNESDLVAALTAMEQEGWLNRKERQNWELTLEGARAVEEALPRQEQLRARDIRAQVLEAICESETAERDLPLHYREACSSVDAQGGEVRAAVRWLVAEGYVHWYHAGGYISCTPAGKAAYRRMTGTRDPTSNSNSRMALAGGGLSRFEE